MLTIHHLGVSQSERIVWLCEELELAYDLVRYSRDPVTRLAPAAYKALHPFGTALVLDDGPLRLAESGAILEYLAHVHGGGRLTLGTSHADYADFLHWWRFATASFMPAALTDGLLRRLGVEVDPLTEALCSRLDTAYAMIEARLGEATWFAGDAFTLADIVMLFPLTTLRRFRRATSRPSPICSPTSAGSASDRPSGGQWWSPSRIWSLCCPKRTARPGVGRRRARARRWPARHIRT